jgi:hypothetical protein
MHGAVLDHLARFLILQDAVSLSAANPSKVKKLGAIHQLGACVSESTFEGEKYRTVLARCWSALAGFFLKKKKNGKSNYLNDGWRKVSFLFQYKASCGDDHKEMSLQGG